MLSWVFGKVKSNTVNLRSHDRAAGYLEFENARVRWFLSINADCLPEQAKAEGKPTYRSITLDGQELEFSTGFTDLHTQSYNKILNNEGYRISEALPSLEIVSDIRTATPVGAQGEYHPFVKFPLSDHPFSR